METENLYKAFFDHATDAIYCHEVAGPFIEVNPAACRMLGFEKSEMLQMRPEDISVFRAARSGREAVEAYEKRLSLIDLVILDMVMPDMDGETTFRRLKDLYPEVKVLISSGYSVDGAASRMLAQGCRGFVQKPFLLHELSKKIREALA